MLRFRARTVAATIVAVATIVLTVAGQAPSVRPLEIQDVGLPAIQEGIVWDVNRAPQMPQVLDRLHDGRPKVGRRWASYAAQAGQWALA